MVRMNVDLFEVRRILGQHFDQREANGRITFQSHPKVALCLGIAKRGIVRNFVEDVRGGVTVKKLCRRTLDRRKHVEVFGTGDSHRVAKIHADPGRRADSPRGLTPATQRSVTPANPGSVSGAGAGAQPLRQSSPRIAPNDSPGEGQT